ncbi:MAG: glycosyl hydrolase 115 family protein [Bacteroidales bacterium]
MKKILVLLLMCVASANLLYADIKVYTTMQESYFPLVTNQAASPILLDHADAKVVGIAAEMLADDINAITAKKPSVVLAEQDLNSSTVVVAGTIGKSAIIDKLIRIGKIDASPILNKWEAYIVTSLTDISPTIKQALVVVGSDRRGTAYGLMDISKSIGVSPWIWWSDVLPEKKKELFVASGFHVEDGPSVKYRGIFINDEDWSLLPWIRNTFDPELGNFGPKTYQKVFELMLRLKANYLWPAMHECSNYFNKFEENARLADDYAIVMGGSHCEPLLCTNTTEWDKKKNGEWNYFTNPDKIKEYWAARLQSNGKYENLYTVGMRGIHDGSMPGGKNIDDKARKLEEVFADQREMLSKYTGQAVGDIPQLFCPYKEVLEVYDRGLKVPDDVMICWAEDNQGYMRRLPDEAERKRVGGHALYYHLSYWSDYLWLSSISPQLMSYELTKAADYKVDEMWVFNVGDIKITEKELSFAMDLAWDIQRWDVDGANEWSAYWAAQTFGEKFGAEIGEVMNEFYRLAFRGKPEHIGHTKYSRTEIDKRLRDYDAIASRCEKLYKEMPERLHDAFIHLIYYPVVACKYHNDKIFLSRLSMYHSEKGEPDIAETYAKSALEAWEQVKELTEEYNSTANGKWKSLMSWHPRDLEVFQKPFTLPESKVSPANFLDDPSVILTMDDISRTGNGSLGRQLVIAKGLSIDGKAGYSIPNLIEPIDDIEISKAPFIEFKTHLEKGERQIRIKCLPSHPVSKDGSLRLGVSINEQSPSIIDITAEETFHNHHDCKKTMLYASEACLDGYIEALETLSLDKEEEVSIRIYLLDPALIPYRVECY